MLCCKSSNLYAQDTSTVKLNEWTLTDSYPVVPGLKIQRLDSLQIRACYAQPFTFLFESLTGAYVRSVGNAASATLSVRGAGPEKTNFLWNGFHINSGSLGSTDLSLLRTGMSDKVEMAYGPASSVFGNAGVGASVLLQSEPKFSPLLKIMAGQQYGSYLTGNSFASCQYAGQKHYLHTRMHAGWSPNAFLYQDKSQPEFPWLPMPQAAYHQISVANDLFLRTSPQSELGILMHFNHQYRQIPPSIGGAINQASQLDQNIRIALLSKFYHPRFPNFITRIGAAYFYDNLQYTDNNTKDTARIHQLQAYLLQKWNRWKKLHLQWGLHYQGWLPQLKQYTQHAVEHRLSFSVSANYMPIDRLAFFFSVRQQVVSGYNPPLTASFGSSLHLLQNHKSQLTMQIMLNNGYRLPTLNDRYWTPGGNPNLKAEHSYNAEAGLELTHQLSPSLSIHTQATGFCMWITDWIAWVPQSQGFWSPVNLKHVRNAGIEYSFKIQGKHTNGLIWQAITGYHFTHAVNLGGDNHLMQLIYVPPHSANLFFFISYKGFSATISGKFSDLRYIRTNNSQSLPPYVTANLLLQKTFRLKSLHLSAQCIIYNITNTQYQSIENRPMPGITAHGGFLLEWNHSKITKTHIP